MSLSRAEVPAGDVVAQRQVVYRLPVRTGAELQAYLQPDKKGRTLAHLRLMKVRNGTETFTKSGVFVEVERLPELLLATAMLIVAANEQREISG